ncbi:MAG TPA: ElyC/SanA/YdcF family protein, partial [Patescibacteria group bacterium]|nr:ElyC/SanA/YdcF family protein [Patescibacteria group bacterium]
MIQNIAKKIFIGLIIAVGLFLAADALLIWGVAHVYPHPDHADAIIVLGAAIYTPSLTNRTEEGLRLYENGKADTMVLSGGK